MAHPFSGVLAAFSLATFAFSALAQPHADVGDFCDSSALGSSAGTIERVREVPVPRDPHAFDPEALEHHVQPETADEVTIRLDSGPVIAYTEQAQKDAPQRLQPGQRVRIILNGSIARVEPESQPCFALFSSQTSY